MVKRKTYQRKYSNGEITVNWDSGKCIHSTICFTTLPKVFDPRKHPWVNIKGADSKTIAETVSECPSGALTYLWNK